MLGYRLQQSCEALVDVRGSGQVQQDYHYMDKWLLIVIRQGCRCLFSVMDPTFKIGLFLSLFNFIAQRNIPISWTVDTMVQHLENRITEHANPRTLLRMTF